MNKKQVHVLIPAYNGAWVIGRAIESVYSDRSIADKRVLIVANGCYDGTEDVVRSYRSSCPGLDLHVSDRRIGRIAAINEGLARTPEDVPVLIMGQENTAEGLSSFCEVGQEKRLVLPTLRVVFEEIEGVEAEIVNAYYKIRVHENNGTVCKCGVYGFGVNGRDNLPSRQIPPKLIADDITVAAYYQDNEVGYPDTTVYQRFQEKTLDEIIRKRALYAAGWRQAIEAEKAGLLPATKREIKGSFRRINHVRTLERARAFGFTDGEYLIYQAIRHAGELLADAEGEKIIKWWLGEE
jgi:glycosyltransferase involved in cell wall biosynthesis